MQRVVVPVVAGMCVAVAVLFCGCKRPSPTAQLPPLQPIPYSPATGFTIVGRVLGDQGRPLSAAVVRDAAGKSRKTDATGVFQMPHLAQGQVNLVVTADHFAPQLLKIDVDEKMQPVQLRLERGRLLRGRVTDSKGRSLAGASVRVSIWPQIHTYWLAYLKTGSDGRFQWDGAPATQVKQPCRLHRIPGRRRWCCRSGRSRSRGSNLGASGVARRLPAAASATELGEWLLPEMRTSAARPFPTKRLVEAEDNVVMHLYSRRIPAARRAA